MRHVRGVVEPTELKKVPTRAILKGRDMSKVQDPILVVGTDWFNCSQAFTRVTMPPSTGELV